MSSFLENVMFCFSWAQIANCKQELRSDAITIEGMFGKSTNWIHTEKKDAKNADIVLSEGEDTATSGEKNKIHKNCFTESTHE